MANATCTDFSNCTVLDGGMTNGTIWVAAYNASAPVPYWHQRMELATVCVCNSLSLIIITARVAYRWSWLHRFRGDDRFVAVAGITMLFYFASQIGTSRYGGGLKVENVPMEWRKLHWQFELGWAGYYIITSLIKISVCLTFLEILPHHRKLLRYIVYGLIVLIGLLGLALTLAWIFQCTPFLSNFLWSVSPASCVNYDIFRWMWIGLSIPIDLVILAVPLHILSRLRMPERERNILRLVFSANLLGTITCVVGIYGVYENRVTNSNQGFYYETIFIMMNDIEILMYTVGASFPVFSRYLVSRSDPQRSPHSNFSSWARHIPDFFHPATSPVEDHLAIESTVTPVSSHISVKSHKKSNGHQPYTYDQEMKVESHPPSVFPDEQTIWSKAND